MKGSRGVIKQIDAIAGDLYVDIDKDKRTVSPDWDTVVRLDEGTEDVPMEVVIPKRRYKSYLEMPGKDSDVLKRKTILDYIIDKFGWMVPSFNFTYKYSQPIKALDRLTEYALGKRTTSYTSKKRKEDTQKVIDYIKSQHIHAPGTAKQKQAYLEIIVDGLIHRNMEYIRLKTLSMRHYGGVILFSGGLDSVALAMARNIKEGAAPLLPIYISHRSNVGNVTKKEIRTAQKLAKKILGEELMVIKADTKSGNLPEWYGKRVFVTEHMPVAKTQKNKRNRKFLEVLQDYGLADRQVWVGVLGIPGAGDRSRAAGRAKDVTKEGLQEHLKSIGGKGKIKVVRDIPGVKTKADLLKKIEKHYKKRFRPDIFESQSCLMYFNKPCGDCWSCVERAESIMQAYGQDKTPYRKDSKADKIRRKK